jgi:molybdopterin molybdotransferase
MMQLVRKGDTMDAVVDQVSRKTLMSVAEAYAAAMACAKPVSRDETVGLNQSAGRILAETFVARMASPPFTQSAMDGYALVAASGLSEGARLKIVDRVPAGRCGRRLSAGEAARIFTGAPMPEGADAVVMQEHVERDETSIVLTRRMTAGDNVRHQGEDIEPLEPLLKPGIRLDPRHVALLAAQGAEIVAVRSRLRVAVFSTGDELQDVGGMLSCAAVYDSNRPMLLSLIGQAGHDAIDGGRAVDSRSEIAERLRMLSERADLVISTGGASVGEEDHSLDALRHAGGSGRVLKIALKPAKPAIVGRIGQAAYLGLPGNPVASLVSWLILGQAMVGALQGRPHSPHIGYPLAIASGFARRPGRVEFVPARLVSAEGQAVRVEIIGKGSAAQLRPLAFADGLAEIAAECGDLRPGDLIRFHPFSGAFQG